MTLKAKNNSCLVLGFLLVFILIFINRNNAFFWDTVHYGSKQASFFWYSGFTKQLVPDDIDSGYVPTFGMALALVWKIFGRTLAVSHLAMLSFAIGIVYQLYKACSKFIASEYTGIALLLIVIDPSLMSQMTLVSPDVPLVFFFLLGTNTVLENRKWWVALCILALFLISMRGVMVSFCLLLLDLHCNISFKEKAFLLKKLLRRSLLYLPGLLFVSLYQIDHYVRKGWILTHKDSPWAGGMEVVDAKRLFFNAGLIGWHILDYGKVGIWLVFLILVFKLGKNLVNQDTRLLIFLSACLLLFVHIDMIWASNLLSHRYFIPFTLVFSLLCAAVLFSGKIRPKLRNGLAAIWIVAIISGNFWVYPEKISQGWDATLAHLPYYGLRKQAIAYIEKEKIPVADVQSFFPNAASFDIIDLNHDARGFSSFDGSTRFVLISNAFNMDDAVYDNIVTHYQLVRRFENRGIYFAIYRKP